MIHEGKAFDVVPFMRRAVVLCLGGTWLGGLIGRMTGTYEEGHSAGFLMAFLGALVVLFVYSLAVG